MSEILRDLKTPPLSTSTPHPEEAVPQHLCAADEAWTPCSWKDLSYPLVPLNSGGAHLPWHEVTRVARKLIPLAQDGTRTLGVAGDSTFTGSPTVD